MNHAGTEILEFNDDATFKTNINQVRGMQGIGMETFELLRGLSAFGRMGGRAGMGLQVLDIKEGITTKQRVLHHVR
jgi:hypothetical protein